MRHKLLAILLLLESIELVGPLHCRAEPSAKLAERLAAEAAQHSDQGSYEAAIDGWKAACNAWRKAQRSNELTDALLELGAAYRALGRHRLAQEAYDEALPLARTNGDPGQLIAALTGLGGLMTNSHHPDEAGKYLQEALQLARANKDAHALAGVLNSVAAHEASQGSMPKAVQLYGEAITLADQAGQKLRAACFRSNLAEALLRNGTFDEALATTTQAFAAAVDCPSSHDQAFCLLRLGRIWEQLLVAAPAPDSKWRLDALRAYEQAVISSTAIHDDRALSFALGYTGHLYEQEGKFEEAARLTNRATVLAQRLRSPDILYRWEWQTGRIAHAQGRVAEATDACRRAVDLLENIRTDLSSHLGNVPDRLSFRDSVGGVYFLLADLLLQRADSQVDAGEVIATIKQARDVCEQLKTVELEDYFQDDCVNLVRKKKESVEDILSGVNAPGGETAISRAAVVYIISLPDRTETIITLPDGLHRVKCQVASQELTAVVRAFREHLEKRITNEYLTEAWQLYDWLIRPLEPLLSASQINTLVFVPDGALRTIPMAALHDGQHFLIEKYAVAVTPGLTLMEPHPMTRANTAVVASGLSESVQGYPALPAVGQELQQLDQRFHGTTLLNQNFLTERVQQEFKDKDYSIVHIASHGEFNSDVRKTFVLTYDGQFSLNMLERLIRPAQLRDKPVEMLALSACQTAAGDDRAALGLAGVAVKAGARSAFATLWSVNDEASAVLIAEFYAGLFGSQNLTKAEALRSAQQKLLSDPRYNHPCLWSPYLIIGNWL